MKLREERFIAEKHRCIHPYENNKVQPRSVKTVTRAIDQLWLISYLIKNPSIGRLTDGETSQNSRSADRLENEEHKQISNIIKQCTQNVET